MYSLTIDNRRLKQENQEQQITIYELQKDLEYLQKSIENHLPVISHIEVKNKELEGQVTAQNKNIKQINNVQTKLRAMENKYEVLE